MAEYAEVALVDRLAGAFAAGAPRARLRLTPLNGGDAAEQLDSGAIDIAVAHLRALPARFDSMVLLRDPFVVVARRDHPRLGRKFSIEDYAALDHLLVSPRGDTTGAIDRMLLDFGLSRRISLLVATYLAVPAALAASDLVATVPTRVAQRIAATADMAIAPLPVDFAATVSLAWHRRTASDPAQSWFRSLLIGAAAGQEGTR
jgi:DNA-binding transcriptional LysR family regulator